MNFKIDAFEGTLNELRDGIKSGKLNIYEVPLAEIAKQFLEEMERLKRRLPTDDLSDFYKGVSELIFIKSQMLLPGQVTWSEDDETDLRNKVVDALEKLRFSRYITLLDEFQEQQSLDFSRFESDFRIPFADDDILNDVDAPGLFRLYKELIERAEELKEGQSTAEGGKLFNVFEKVTISEKIAYLIELFEEKDEVRFEELVHHLDDINHITCAFQAALSAIHMHIAGFRQESIFAPLYLIKKEQSFDTFGQDELDSETEEAEFSDEDDAPLEQEKDKEDE